MVDFFPKKFSVTTNWFVDHLTSAYRDVVACYCLGSCAHVVRGEKKSVYWRSCGPQSVQIRSEQIS